MSGSRANQAAINRRASGIKAAPKNTIQNLNNMIKDTNQKSNTLSVPINQVVSLHNQIIQELKIKVEKFESNDNSEENEIIQNVITDNNKLKENISSLNEKINEIEKKYSELQGLITQLSVQIVSNK
tara:strand:- start:489 stop:869 length:381 start_codon:yes stop_codon:yes gene_type:complete